MSTNGNGQFLESELIHRKVKVDNEWQTRTFPVVGGRLRLAHEQNDSLSLQTEMVNWDGEYAVFKCCAVTGKGQYIGYGTANSQRDAKLADSLVELAETRSIARALRFAGFGLEFTSAEEVSHVANAEPVQEQSSSKQPAPVFAEGNGNGKVGAKAPSGAPAEPIIPSETQTKAPDKPVNKGIGGGKATQAQARALFALTRKAKMCEEEIAGMLSPFNVTRFEDLMLPDASRLIQSLQIEVAA
jgi:hypothetical protein